MPIAAHDSDPVSMTSSACSCGMTTTPSMSPNTMSPLRTRTPAHCTTVSRSIIRARPRESLAFDYLVPDGLDSNEVDAFDLMLPPGFAPRNEDGEVAGFELLRLDEVHERLQAPHLFTVDAALVAWACVQRWAGAPE